MIKKPLHGQVCLRQFCLCLPACFLDKRDRVHENIGQGLYICNSDQWEGFQVSNWTNLGKWVVVKNSNLKSVIPACEESSVHLFFVIIKAASG